jgi:type II secretion system protein D
MRNMQLTCALIVASLVAVSPLLAAQPATTTTPTTKSATKPATKAPTTQVAAKAPTTQPTTQATTQPTTRPRVKIERPKTDLVRFHYQDVPCADVVKRFAQMANKPLIGEVAVEGKLTFMDAEPYTYEEALDTLNIILSMRGFRLMEFGRFMQLTPLSKLPEMPLKIIRGLDNTKAMRGSEIATVLLPLKTLEADAAAKTVVRMVSAYGSIVPMPRGRGVIITDNIANIRRVSDMLNALDSDEAQVVQTIHTVVLENATATEASVVIGKLFGPLGIFSKSVYSERYRRSVPTPATAKDIVTVNADKRTNSVILVGMPDRLAMAEAMLKQLDTPEGAGDTEVRIFELKNAKATTVSKMLSELTTGPVRYYTGKDGKSRPIPSSSSAKGNKAKVVADEIGNRIIVSGTAADIEKIAVLIEKLDKGVTLSGGMKIFPLKNADAEQIAQIVIKATGRPDSRGTFRSTLQISPDGRTNSLVVVGSPTDVTVAEGVIKELDRAPEKEPYEIHVIQLKSGNAEILDKALENLFASRSGQQAGIPGFRVEADNSSNSLMISVPPAHWTKVKDAIEKLTKNAEDSATPPTLVVKLKYATAKELAGTLKTLYPSSKSSRYDTPGIIPVSIAYNTSSNSLVLSASKEDLDSIAALIASIDVEKAAEIDPIRIVHLKSANADKVAEMLTKMLPAPTYGEAPSVFVQGDSRTKTLLIRASESKWKMLDDMIKKLDELTEGQVETRVLPLKYANAKNLAATLQGIYNQSSSSSRSSSSPYSSYSSYSSSRYGSSSRSRSRGGSSSSGVPVTIAFNTDSNSLVVSASLEDHIAIAALVKSIDVEKAGEIDPIRIVHLKSANADKVAEMLTKMLPPTERGEAPDIFIQGDSRTKTLLIRASESKSKMLDEMIQKLDALNEGQVETRVLQLKYANARDLADTLKGIYAPSSSSSRSSSSSSRYSRYSSYSPPSSSGSSSAVGKSTSGVPVTIAYNTDSNTLVISASVQDHEAIAALVKSIDVEKAAQINPIRIVSLKSGNANKVATMLQEMLPPKKRGEDPDVFIRGDEHTGALMIRAPESKWTMLNELIAKLDGSIKDLARETRLLPVKHVSAAEIVVMLQQLYPIEKPSTRRRSYYDYYTPPPAPKAKDPNRVVVSASPDDRALLVDAPKSKIEEIAQLITTLDTDTGAGAIETRIYKLTNSSASEIATSLTALFAKEKTASKSKEIAPRFQADSAANQLLVAATAKQFLEIEKLIDKVAKTASVSSLTKTFVLQHAKADDVVPVLQTMLTQQFAASSAAPRGRTRGRTATPTSSTVRVSAMSKENIVVVQGSPEVLTLAASLILTFDTPKIGSKIVIEIIQLKNAQATTLAEAINATLARQAASRQASRRGSRNTPTTNSDETVTVTPEPNSNSVLIRGPESEVPAVKAMIMQLDSGGTSGALSVKIFPLKNGEASELAKSVGKLFQDMIKQYARGNKSITPPPFSITADDRTNSLIVSTTATHFALVQQILDSLDQAPERSLKIVRYIWLENANATDVADKLIAMYADKRGADKPVIESDIFANAITIIGKDADIKTMENVITDLDEAAIDNSVQVQVVPLQGVQAAKMADVIRRVYGQMSDAKIVVTESKNQPTGAAPGPKGAAGKPTTKPAPTTQAADDELPPIVIAVDAESNSLIISATRIELENVTDLILRLSDSTTGGEAEFRSFKIEHGDPTIIAKTLSDLFNPPKQKKAAQPRGNQGRGNRGAAPTPAVVPPPVITVVADQRTSSVIVRAKPMDFDIIEPLVKQLDTDATVLTEVRVFVLKNTDAAEVASNLKELFKLSASGNRTSQTNARSRGGSGRSAQQQRAEMIRAAMQAGNAQAPASTQTELSVTANSNTNSIIVSAQPETMKIIESLIEELDQSAALTKIPTIRLYPLKHADITQTVQTLQQLFVSSGSTGAARTRGATRGTTRGGTSNDMPIVITAQETSRTVLVSAPVEKHELIAKTIEQIDSSQATDALSVKVYRIQNVEAAGVATSLTATLSQGSSGTGRGKTTSTSTGLRISADRSSNTLVVKASTEDHKKIALLLLEIDEAPATKYPIQMITVRNADPTKLAEMLMRVFTAQSGSSGGSRGRGSRGSAVRPQNVIIEPAQGSRMLIVRADEKTFTKIKEMAGQLDATTPQGQSTRTLLTLKNAQASSVAAALTQAFAPQRGVRIEPDDLVTIVAEGNSNSIIVTANPKKLEAVQALLAKLDTEEAGGRKTEFVLLKNAKADELATVLSKIAAASGGQASSNRGRRPRGATATSNQQVVVSADMGSNALVMTGPATELTKLMQMAVQLDQAAQQTGQQVFVIPLKNGNATAVASVITNMYKQQVTAAKRSKRSVEPLAVSADDRANALILATSAIMYAQVSEWVKQVEGMKPSRGTLRVITLEHADAEEVDKAIQQIYNNSGTTGNSRTNKNAGRRGAAGTRGKVAPATTTGGQVETTVLSKQRAILVNASDEDFKAIEALVKTLESAAISSKRLVKAFVLKNANPSRTATALTAAFRTRGGQTKPEDEVTVSAIQQTRTVMVAATKEKMEEVAALIEVLDKVDVAGPLQFKLFPLENTTPAKILPALRGLITQLQRQTGGEAIDISADERTRSLIITTRETLFEQIGEIITRLDKPSKFSKTEVLIIPLKKADATRLAGVLNEMLRPSGTALVTPEARALQQQIKILKVRGVLKKDAPELDLTQPIKISADAATPSAQGSNSLLITSTPDNLKAMKVIVEMLDTVPIGEGVLIRIVRLEKADAETVRDILDDIFNTQGKKLAGPTGTSTVGKVVPESTSGKALVNGLNVSADLRTNTLVMSGLAESLALAEILIKDLDRTQDKFVTEVKLFKLKNADAARLLPVLRGVFTEPTDDPAVSGVRTFATRLQTAADKKTATISDKPKTRAAFTIQADTATNVLVVAARKDLMAIISDVITGMDIPGAGSLNTVRIFPLINADGTRLRTVLQELYSGSNASLIRIEDRPTVSMDTRTNSLIISANDKTFTMISNLLKNLDQKTPIDLRDIRLVTLKNAEADTMSSVLQTMMDARVQRQQSLGVKDAESLRVIVVADARSNSLIVGGSAEGYKIVKDLAEQLDNTSAALSGQIQLIPLKEANVGTITTTLSNLFDQRYQAARTEDIRRQKPVILPDLRTNSLLVAANNDDTKVLMSLLKNLDVKLTDPAVKLVVIPMLHNDSGIVGPMIREIFAARLVSMTPQGTTPAPQDRVDVSIDSLTNALVISANKENLTLIEGLLKKVDIEPPMETGIIRMFPLKNADAQRVSTLLSSLITQGLYKPGAIAAGTNSALANREKVAVAVDTRTNILIVSASKENFAVIEELIRKIDSDDAVLDGDIRAFRLKKANATNLADTLNNLYRAKLQAEQASGASGRSLPTSIIADTRTNTLLVTGSRESFKSIADMIKQLDTGDSARITEIKVFELKSADAAELTTILLETLTTAPKSAISDPNVRQAMLKFVTTDKDGKMVIAQALQEGLLITPDSRNNSLVVSAPAENMPLLANLIKALDNTTPRSAEIKVFPLKNADATRMGEVLTQLFRLQQTGAADSKSIKYTLTTTQPVGENGEVSATLGSAEQNALTVTVDTRTNSLLVGGTTQYVELAGSVIKELDASPAQERQTKIYRLRNAQATDIQTALRSFLDQERQTIASALGADGLGAAHKLLEQEVAIVAEETTNTLLLSASPRYFKAISDMIDELDQPLPQVLIKVLLAEVTLSGKSALGFEWDARGQHGSSTSTTGTNFGVAGAFNTNGGFRFSLAGGDVDLFLMALQTEGRLEVLSRPQILTADNQTGEINVGQRVPFITNSRVTDEGSVFNTIQYEDVGIILQATPRINPDGDVKLEVNAEISSISDSDSVEIGEGISAIVLNNRSATTTVTVKDGHTIVIGGLITTADNNTEQKIPFLGDLPLVGELFKTTTITTGRTELLIVLTPYIQKNTEDADAETKTQVKRVKLLSEQRRQGLLEWLTEQQPYKNLLPFPVKESTLKGEIARELLPLELLADDPQVQPAPKPIERKKDINFDKELSSD